MAADTRSTAPPVAKVEPKVLEIHGDRRIDPYFWLRDKSNPDTIAYLEAENRFTEASMAHTQALQQKLYREIVGRVKETDLSVPVKDGPYAYYTRTEGGKQYPILCRKKAAADASEEIILDQNELAAGTRYFRTSVIKVSPNHELLAFGVDTEGNEEYVLRVKDLRAGRMLPDRVPNTTYGVEWAADNRTLFYSTLAPTKRADKLWRHRLGDAPAADKLVFHEPDERFGLRLSASRAKDWLLLTLSSHMSSEVRCLAANQPDGEFQLVEARRADVEYFVEPHGKTFYIWSNDTGKNFRLVSAPAATPGKEHWQEEVPHRANVTIERADVFRNYLVVSERDNGLEKLVIRSLRSGKLHSVSFPEPTYSVSVTGNAEYDTSLLRFSYSSFITPASVYDYDMDRRTRDLKKRTEVPNYDPALYSTERVFATAADGAKVPVSLVYRKGLARDGKAPLFLYGYGSYGITIPVAFEPSRFSLIDRGFVYALAHIRGGADMGRLWYDPNGKMLTKKNTFTDFIACAEHLAKTGYTSAGRIAINGGSAGGLLMGAVTNQRPDLFRAVVAEVPFVDVITTELDESLPGTVTEWEEWGNPNKQDYYDYMKSYSPYDNVKPMAYPSMLVTAGLNDPRVGYWEPAKWVAKLRVTKTDRNVLLLKTNMGAGHFGRSGRYERFHEVAFRLAFVLDRFGITE